MAGDIDELKSLSEKLCTEDGGQKARALSQKMLAAVPRFEATEEVRAKQPPSFNYSTEQLTRNGNDESIDRLANSNSNDQNLASRCMKAVRAVSGCGTLTLMTKMMAAAILMRQVALVALYETQGTTLPPRGSLRQQ